MAGVSLETWQLIVVILGSIVVGCILLVGIVKVWATGAYERIKQNPATECNIDEFVDTKKNPVSAVKVVLAHKIQIGNNRNASFDPIPLELYKSSHVDQLYVSQKSGTGSTTSSSGDIISLDQLLSETKPIVPIVIATIRMGFGHHRLAYSTASWALQQTDHPVIFHDLLNIKSRESDLIKSTDELYSKFSRWASEMGGPIEKIWGQMMLSGNADALRIAANTAAHLQPLLLAYPKNTPIITTHQLCALTAACAGYTNVINLVVDNHPQWFLTVPKTINIVQGPVNYESFLRMGIQPKELRWTGHWCPHDMVSNIDIDCQRRIDRIMSNHSNSNSDFKPLRLLIPVGGAGAQRKFIIKFVKAVADHVKDGKVQLFLNAGDHVHMKTAFLQVLDECNIDFDIVSTTDGVRGFQQNLLADPKNEPNKNVTLFAFDEYFPAVATTDIMCRVTDVLCCKPSELAFYCVPKLHIRRVGDHEADSAKRSSELGDGTLEARELEDAMEYISMFLSSPDLLKSMNEAIIKNNKIGIYSGCQRAVELALQRRT